jgi:conjugative relaxase-like TrwC/TraI family protein
LVKVSTDVPSKANRRAGYDATFDAPKSVSIQAFLGGDERWIAAHERAVTETLAELELFLRTRKMYA